MRLLFDTSTLIAALLKPHEAHGLAHPWLDQVLAGADVGVVSAHSLAELYSTLTRMPLRPSISGADALELIRENILSPFEIVGLLPADYVAILDDLQSRNLVGGITYHALIMYIAVKVRVDKVITLNGRDFARLFPHFQGEIVVLRK
ncbi:MAG: PIN domain-containing protein [Caldilineaceae bacterium]|nr:PIN domain-containing protein [Caldilineaceae bacterium]